MNDLNSTSEARSDHAWVSIETPYTEADLKAFCLDVERLFRINPLLEIRSWTKGEIDNEYKVSWHNQGNGMLVETTLNVLTEPDEMTITYKEGIKSRTRIRTEPSGDNAKLVITDEYAGLDDNVKQERIGEVDNTLTRWGAGIRQYLVKWERWSWFPLYRWYVLRFWLTMKPVARRIAQLLIWITIGEFVVFLFVVLIYWMNPNMTL